MADNLPRRIFRCSLSTTIIIIIALIPGISDVYGKAVYLGCVTAVFVFVLPIYTLSISTLTSLFEDLAGHPGRRLGAMIEALSLATVGATVGVAWASLGTYLYSLLHPYNPEAGMAIKAVFVVCVSFAHGYIRASTPRLYLMVLFMIVPSLIGLTTPSPTLSSVLPRTFFCPILTAIATLLLVSALVFPEYGSTQLAVSTIEALQTAQSVQTAAVQQFMSYSSCGGQEDRIVHFKDLTKLKTELGKKLNECINVYGECSFELAFSVLAPRELKPIARKGIKGLANKTARLVGACESAYSFLGFEEGRGQAESQVEKARSRRGQELGDEQLLIYLLKRVEAPLTNLQDNITRALDIVSACIAYAYDVSDQEFTNKRPQGHRPTGILVQEVDVDINWLLDAIEQFGKSSSDALEGAAIIDDISETDPGVDMMPREEVFLVSSFVMNIRRSATHVLDMLRHSRVLIERRQDRKYSRSLHFPRVKLRKWLSSGNEEPQTLPSYNKEGLQDATSAPPDPPPKTPKGRDEAQDRAWSAGAGRLAAKWHAGRELLGKFLDWMNDSDAFLYASKFTLGMMLVTWPAFVESWAQWYNLIRGVWSPIIFVLVFENAVGSTIWIFALRAVGTVLGSLWGYAAYEARDGNEFVITIMLMLGTIPNYYVQLGTKYQKAGMVCTISMCVVALSTHLQTVPGTATEIFWKRVTTMLIGGGVATLVQITVFPVKARDRLKESLAGAIMHIIRMESYIALGVDETCNFNTKPELFKRFERAFRRAQASLDSAEAFLSFTVQEPRLKGSFNDHACVYKEIIYVLRQIADRMDNMVELRNAYGSAVLEQYNSIVYNYRRNVAASVTLILYVVRQALTTKIALPQFLPSIRLAHRRMVVRIRQILTRDEQITSPESCNSPDSLTIKRDLRLKFLSWNASSAALEECIEYLEELTDLTKILVGASEFRSGMLNRVNYAEYTERLRMARAKTRDGVLQARSATFTSSFVSQDRLSAAVEEIPNPLVRIQSRRQEARMGRRRAVAGEARE